MYITAEMSLAKARARLSKITNQAEYIDETVYVTKHGRRTSAVVPAAAAERSVPATTSTSYSAATWADNALRPSLRAAPRVRPGDQTPGLWVGVYPAAN